MYMVGHTLGKMAREQEDVITFSAKDRQHHFLHNKPLYVEAKANELGVRRALVDNGASVNLMPQSIFKALPHGQDRLIPHEVTLSGFDSNKSKTMGHIMVDLKVGPIRGPTRFHVLEEETSYHLLLGRPWIHAHNCVPSTLHQCLKASIKGKIVHINATKAPFTAAEAHLAEAILFDETALTEASMMTRPRGVPLIRSEEEIKQPKKYEVRRVLLPGGRKAYRL